MDADVQRIALEMIDRDLPDATTVLVGGSAARGERRPTSDIDVLVLAPAERFAPGDSLARTTIEDGQRLELFAYSLDSFARWSEHDYASLRPVLPFLLVEGVALREGPELAALRAEARARLDAGPRLDAHALDRRRYAITDLLDDLADADDAFVESVVRAELVRALGEFLLLAANRWLGTGKWLVRRLRAWDPDAAADLERMTTADPATAVAIAAFLLEPHGGRLDGAFTR